MEESSEIKVLIIGGGFAGINTALALEKKKPKNVKLTLVNNANHFQYMPALYRVVTGKSPMEVCIQITEILEGKDVNFVEDTIDKVDIASKTVSGNGGEYKYDYLILALGSETAYYDVPGLNDLSFGFKSITEALELKNHLHTLFEEAKSAEEGEQTPYAHIVIVGGGASGTEVAGELAVYTDTLAKNHGIDPSLVTIDLIHSRTHLLPKLPEDMSVKIENKLHALGVNLFLNRRVIKEDIETVYLKDMEMKAKTLIWTAGIAPNHLYSEIPEFKLDKGKRVEVDEYLQAIGVENVFVVGDGAATKFSGMAQTASLDGKFAANAILAKINGNKPPVYRPKQPSYAIPVGPGWAAVWYRGIKFYGRVGWMLRRLADFRFFLSILPPRKAYLAFASGKTLCESCAICTPEYAYKTEVDKSG